MPLPSRPSSRGIGDLSEEAFFFTDNDKFLLFLATSAAQGYTATAQDLDLLREAVARVRAQFPGVQAG